MAEAERARLCVYNRWRDVRWGGVGMRWRGESQG